MTDKAMFVLQPGRSADRIDSHHAVITCQGCGEPIPFERVDGEPLTNRDINEALVGLDHECPS